MHSSSADELLRTRPVSELRQLISSLEKDYSAKQTDLRQMVGSKYLDFIESADAIASMYKETENLSATITKFQVSSGELVGKIHDVLEITARPTQAIADVGSDNSLSNSSSGKKYSSNVAAAAASMKKVIIDSSKVWDYLEVCDVANASRVIYLSNAILYFCQLQNSSNSNSSKPAFIDSIMPNHQVIVPIMTSLGDEKTLKTMWQLLKLSNTVVGDSELIILSHLSSAYDVANSLIATSILNGSAGLDKSKLSKSELLQLYLSKMDILLDVNLKGTNDNSTDSSSSEEKDSSNSFEGDVDDDNYDSSRRAAKSDAIAKNLIDLVKTLKRILLFVHNIFFRDAQCPVSDFHHINLMDDNIQAASPSSSGQFINHIGILQALELSYFYDTSSDLVRYLQTNRGLGKYSKMDENRFKHQEYIKNRNAQSHAQEQQLRVIFDSWFGDLVKKISRLLYQGLGLMDSATNIARLQQQLWREITQLSPISTGRGGEMFRQSDWELACKALLSPSSPAVAAKASSSSVPSVNSNSNKEKQPALKYSTMLWSAIFRKPFMTQVERILSETCIEIFNRIKSKIQQTLLTEGISIDVANKKVTFCLDSSSSSSSSAFRANVLRRVTPTQSSQSSSKDQDAAAAAQQHNEPHIDGCFASFQSVISSCQTLRLYRHAENIRSIIENEFKVLLNGVVLPVQEGDSLSSSALSRALFVQSCHLIGHISIYLREASELISSELMKSFGFKYPNPKRSFLLSKIKSESTTSLRIPSDSELRLFCGILFMGRLSWVLKLKREVFSEALSTSRIGSGGKISSSADDGVDPSLLSSPSSSSSSDASWTARDFEFCSEDQLMSAFEIADTDGDGVLTHAETLEAIQALVVTDDSSSDAPDTSHLVSKWVASSMSFSEFVLIYSHLLTYTDCSKISKHFRQSLDDIMHINHHVFSEALILLCNSQLYHSLRKEFSLARPSTTKISLFQTSLWKEHTIGSHNNSDIKVLAPQSSSQAYSHYWFQLTTILSVFSTIDVCQLDSAAESSTSSKISLDLKYGLGSYPVKSLYKHIKKLLCTKSIASIIEVYKDILSNLELTRSSYADETNSESVAIQCMFDLMSFESICACADDPESKASVRAVIAKFKGFLDPVNESSIMPIISDSCAQYMTKSTLLNMFMQRSGTISTTFSGEGDASAKKMTYDLFSSASPARFGLLALPMALSGGPSASSSVYSTTAATVGTSSSASAASKTKVVASTSSQQQPVKGNSSSSSQATSTSTGFFKGFSSLLG